MFKKSILVVMALIIGFGVAGARNGNWIQPEGYTSNIYWTQDVEGSSVTIKNYAVFDSSIMVNFSNYYDRWCWIETDENNTGAMFWGATSAFSTTTVRNGQEGGSKAQPGVEKAIYFRGNVWFKPEIRSATSTYFKIGILSDR